jgi:hypothetical protein
MKFDWSASWQTVQRMGTGFLAALPGCGWPSASPSRPSSRTSWPASSFSSRVRSASATRSASKEYEGTVEDIEARATLIKTYDGRRAIIPNGELYTNSVLVDTAFPQRRWQYDIGIGYGDDVERARRHPAGPE